MSGKTTVTYYISCGGYLDGKSVCLWRQVGAVASKIARFQSDEAARKFATEFKFPLSERVHNRLHKNDKNSSQ